MRKKNVKKRTRRRKPKYAIEFLPMKDSGRRIALVMHNWVGYLYGVQQGIADYVLHQPDWSWTRIAPTAQELARLPYVGADGVIAYVESPFIPLLQSLGVPVVCVSNWEGGMPFPCVLPDDYAVGKLGAKYLLDLGLKNFGVVGFPGNEFSDKRRLGFTEALKEDGFSAINLMSRTQTSSARVEVAPGVDRLTLQWLLDLPKPAGVFATTDMAGAEILEVCRHAHIRVPDDVCVLGVDNDDLIHRFSHPPLSSIALPTQRIGQEAAKLLDALMAGKSPPTKPILLPPAGVVTRQSTNVLAIVDQDVQAAVRYIRERIRERITVRDVLQEIAVSRRYLERKFLEHLGRTPLQEIIRVRVSRAKELLSGTDLAMSVVARQSGFANAGRLARVFHSVSGITPTDYRRRFRLRSPAHA